mmetsp:Transcript_13318/g.33954  ORF Transcript_13318/g.33954 Transcript_13318/m.33954 type:complete len:98 (-) Transcript_13318:304-597(-)
MAQPGIRVFKGDTATVLYSWRILPSIMNAGGASDRPVIEDVWGIVQDKLDGKAVDPAREKNVRLTSKKDWRVMHKGVINFMKSLPSLLGSLLKSPRK